MKVKLAKWGNSTAVRLPKSVVDSMGLKPGQELELKQVGTTVQIETNARPVYFGLPYYSMEELVEEARRLGPENVPETVDWGPDVGSEIIDDDYSRGLIEAADDR